MIRFGINFAFDKGYDQEVAVVHFSKTAIIILFLIVCLFSTDSFSKKKNVGSPGQDIKKKRSIENDFGPQTNPGNLDESESSESNEMAKHTLEFKELQTVKLHSYESRSVLILTGYSSDNEYKKIRIITPNISNSISKMSRYQSILRACQESANTVLQLQDNQNQSYILKIGVESLSDSDSVFDSGILLKVDSAIEGFHSISCEIYKIG